MTSAAPAAGSNAVVDGVNVDAVTAAVARCAAVEDPVSSPTATVASYLPGRQVAGVRVGADTVTIQVRGRWGIPLPELGRQVRAAVAPLVGRRRIDIVVADVGDAPARVGSAGTSSGDEVRQWTTAPSAPPALPVAPSSVSPTPIVVATPTSS